MKRYICIFLFLLIVLGVKAQSNNFSANQLFKAMECRMMKATAYVVQKNGQLQSTTNPPVVRFTLFYGGKSSGYSSEDWICLLGDDSNEWNRNGYQAFMDMPTSVRKQSKAEGDAVKHAIYNYFYADGFTLCLLSADSSVHKSQSQVVVMNLKSDENCFYLLASCDFYDISTGQERLVLKGYQPSLEDYSAGNLFRVFMDRMYEYYR